MEFFDVAANILIRDSKKNITPRHRSSTRGELVRYPLNYISVKYATRDLKNNSCTHFPAYVDTSSPFLRYMFLFINLFITVNSYLNHDPFRCNLNFLTRGLYTLSTTHMHRIIFNGIVRQNRVSL